MANEKWKESPTTGTNLQSAEEEDDKEAKQISEIIDDHKSEEATELKNNKDKKSSDIKSVDETTSTTTIGLPNQSPIKLTSQENSDVNDANTLHTSQISIMIDEQTGNHPQNKTETKQSDIICFGVQFQEAIRMISIPDCMVIKDLIELLQQVFCTSRQHRLYYNNTVLDGERCFQTYENLNGCILVYKE